LAAHLDACGTERRIFGLPFSTWRDRMPQGMLLRSEPYASDVAAPNPGFGVGDYCRTKGLPYTERRTPLSRETFLAYGDWFARSLVPDVDHASVTSVESSGDGFRLSTAGGEQLQAANVVVATGIVPFAYLPPVLRALPEELASHSSSHADLSGFVGRRVAVVGRGQSALETAAILHELGAEVELIGRGPIWYNKPVPATSTFWTSVRKPINPLCETWHCWGYYTFPDVFRAFPERLRVEKARTVLGPSGAWWLQSRLEGQVPLRTGLQVLDARTEGAKVRLVLGGDGGGESVYDHVISATGFRLDLERLGYLAPQLRRSVTVAGGAPVLSRSFESTVPGLFFVGAMAAPSLGPAMRFIAGTWFTAKRLSKRLASSRHGGHQSQRDPGAPTDAVGSGVPVEQVAV
jgi:FAD-dependent urate hydroxylase